MTRQEHLEWSRLSRKWATGKATMREMLRCMALTRKAQRKATDKAEGGAA